MKKKLISLILVILFSLSLAAPILADRGGGPGSNHGCPGHQPPPPPHRGCGK